MGNIIDNWLKKYGSKKIAKQVEHEIKELSKCKCDKYLASKGFHNNGCKYAIEFNKLNQ